MKVYCRICEEETQHTFRGLQRGVRGKTLELYDCLTCIDIPTNSSTAQQFRQNHYHLSNWLNSGLGQTYLRRQINESKRTD